MRKNGVILSLVFVHCCCCCFFHVKCFNVVSATLHFGIPNLFRRCCPSSWLRYSLRTFFVVLTIFFQCCFVFRTGMICMHFLFFVCFLFFLSAFGSGRTSTAVRLRTRSESWGLPSTGAGRRSRWTQTFHVSITITINTRNIIDTCMLVTGRHNTTGFAQLHSPLELALL